MNRDQILQTAEHFITVDRAATHGEAEDNFQTIADVWSWWLSNRDSPESPLEAIDIAMMMALFKIARIAGNANHVDNYIDLSGYAALAGEISTEE